MHILLKDKKTYDPRKLDDKILLDDHRIVHAWASTIKRGKKIKGWSWEDVWNAHRLIAQELIRRGFKHNTPLKRNIAPNVFDQPFPAWKRDGTKYKELDLKTVLKAFTGDYLLADPFVYIVGGICNYGKTKGDVDILLRKSQPRDPDEDMAIKFRIARSLAKLGIPEERIQFLYDDFHGPFTSYVPLFSLKAELLPAAKRVLTQMSELAAKAIIPLKFFLQPKPMHGRHREEIYSVDTVISIIKESEKWSRALEEGLYVETKFDGVRCQVHKKGNQIKIFSEDKTDITKKLPILSKVFLSDSDDFVAEFELELWLNGKHQNRADTAAVIHRKAAEDNDKDLHVTIYDVLWLNGKDIHNEPFSLRRKFLDRITGKNITFTKGKEVRSFEELRKAIEAASSVDGSEGAIIKMKNYIYPLTGQTREMMKFKNEFSIVGEVVHVHDVKDSDAFNYLMAIRNRNKKIPLGRSYNTTIRARLGDHLKIVFVDLSKYIDPNTQEAWYNFWAPRVVEKTSEAVASSKIADSLVEKSSGQIQEKVFPRRYKGLLFEDLDLDEENLVFDNFRKMSLEENSEEFNLNLSKGEINKDLIPEELTFSGELRDSAGHLVRIDSRRKALLFLRDEEGNIKEEVMTNVC